MQKKCDDSSNMQINNVYQKINKNEQESTDFNRNRRLNQLKNPTFNHENLVLFNLLYV